MTFVFHYHFEIYEEYLGKVTPYKYESFIKMKDSIMD